MSKRNVYTLGRRKGNPQRFKKGLCVCFMIMFYESVCVLGVGNP